ncbi:MAG: type II toxin -antitoxin system TacA 1-like antitoxin [Methylovirgula sp.]
MRRRSPVIGMRNAPTQVKSDIAEAERLVLSERDSLRVLDLLENPPAASERLKRVAKAGFTLP